MSAKRCHARRDGPEWIRQWPAGLRHRPKSGYTTVSSSHRKRDDNKFSSSGNLMNNYYQQNTEENDGAKMRAYSASKLTNNNSHLRPESAPSYKKLRKIALNDH